MRAPSAKRLPASVIDPEKSQEFLFWCPHLWFLNCFPASGASGRAPAGHVSTGCGTGNGAGLGAPGDCLSDAGNRKLGPYRHNENVFEYCMCKQV